VHKGLEKSLTGTREGTPLCFIHIKVEMRLYSFLCKGLSRGPRGQRIRHVIMGGAKAFWGGLNNKHGDFFG